MVRSTALAKLSSIGGDDTMASFSRILMYPRAATPTLPETVERDLQAVLELAVDIRPLLLTERSSLVVPIEAEHGYRLKALWVPCGDTAGIICWSRDDHVYAVSILAAGLDEQEDSVAFAAVARLCQFEKLTKSSALKTAMQRPPALITLYEDASTAATDAALAIASVAWATAFFGMLGVSREELTIR
jgi:hypothetical protein